MSSPLPVMPTVDCTDPSCSGNGICQRAQCYCYPGYTGDTCNKRVPSDPLPMATTPMSHLATDGTLATTVDPAGSVTPEWGKIPGCSMDCSLHGVFDPSRAICMCDIGWTGRACEQGTTKTHHQVILTHYILSTVSCPMNSVLHIGSSRIVKFIKNLHALTAYLKLLNWNHRLFYH